MINNVHRFSLTLLFMGLLAMNVFAQQSNYQIIKSESVSSSIVRLTFKIYCRSKKIVNNEAQYAALRIALFEGCPNTQYNKPLLEEGEATVLQQFPDYFNNLYSYRVGDFITGCVALSDFKKADKNKATLYEIDVKVLQLRKDLEKNGVKRKMEI